MLRVVLRAAPAAALDRAAARFGADAARAGVVEPLRFVEAVGWRLSCGADVEEVCFDLFAGVAGTGFARAPVAAVTVVEPFRACVVARRGLALFALPFVVAARRVAVVVLREVDLAAPFAGLTRAAGRFEMRSPRRNAAVLLRSTPPSALITTL